MTEPRPCPSCGTPLTDWTEGGWQCEACKHYGVWEERTDEGILTVSDADDDTAMEAFYQGVVDRVELFGWVVQGVFADEAVGSFMYTVGLFRTRFGLHPELVLTVPLPPKTAAHILNDMGSAISQGHRYEPGPIEGALAGDYVPVLIPVTVEKHEEYPLSVANNLFGLGPDHRVEALQLVIPDKEHRMPWDPGYDQKKLPQALLGMPL